MITRVLRNVCQVALERYVTGAQYSATVTNCYVSVSGNPAGLLAALLVNRILHLQSVQNAAAAFWKSLVS